LKKVLFSQEFLRGGVSRRKLVVIAIAEDGRLCVCERERSHLEIVSASTEELISNVQALLAFDPAKEPLASPDSPALVSNVDEDVITT
jgi:hypothetical protein